MSVYLILSLILIVFFAPSAIGEFINLVEKQPFKDLLSGPLSEVHEIVFACRQLNYDGHWYANFGYYADSADRKAYRAMGRLCKLNIRTSQVTVLVDDPEGTIRDPQVHYDNKKIVFSYRKAGSENFNLY